MNSIALVTVLQALLLCCYACYFDDYKRHIGINTDYCDKKLCGGTQTHNHTGCGGCNSMLTYGPDCPTGSSYITILHEGINNIIVERHNYYRNLIAGGKIPGFRAAAKMGYMQWDKELELLASLHSRKCVLRRDDCFAVPRFPSPGQAIAWVGTNVDKLGAYIYYTMAEWFAEHKKSSSAQIQSYEAIDGTEHFTQMVNDRADRIGCGLMWVEKERFLLVCNYAKSCEDNFYVYDPAPEPAVGCETGGNYKYHYLCNATEPISHVD